MLIDSQPFDEVRLSTKERASFLQKLLKYLSEEQLRYFVIASNKKTKFRDAMVFHRGESGVYESNNNTMLVDLMVSCRPWHRGSFTLVVCNQSIIDDLSRRPSLLESR